MDKTNKMKPQEVPSDQLPARLPDPLLKYDCTLAAFAIALEKGVDELIALVGHDGKEIVHPHLPKPLCCRGYHLQEWVDCCLKLGKALVLIEREPISTPNGTDLYRVPFKIEGSDFLTPALVRDARFTRHVYDSRGVLFGRLDSGIGHSLAWVNGQVVDGIGRKTLLHQWPLTVMFFAKILDLAS